MAHTLFKKGFWVSRVLKGSGRDLVRKSEWVEGL